LLHLLRDTLSSVADLSDTHREKKLASAIIREFDVTIPISYNPLIVPVRETLPKPQHDEAFVTAKYHSEAVLRLHPNQQHIAFLVK
jgi:hypothetical protein